MKKFFSKTMILATTLLTTLAMISPFGHKAQADVIKVDPNTNVFSEANSVLIQKNPKISKFEFTTNIDSSRLRNWQVTGNGGIGWSHLDLNNATSLKSTKWVSMNPNTKAYSFLIKDPKPSDWIKTYHGNVGLYKGKAVDVEVKYSNFYYRSAREAPLPPNGDIPPLDEIYQSWGGSNFSVLQVDESLFEGYMFSQLKEFSTTLTFYDSETKQPIQLDKNSYLTFNSLNYHTWLLSEGVKYMNPDPSLKTYLTKDTNVAYKAVRGGATFNAWAGDENDFTDKLGALDFSRNSVSFQLSGTEQEFRIIGEEGYPIWNTYSSGLLSTPPADLIKEERDALTGKRLSIFSPGQKVDYPFTISVAELGTQMVQKYSRYEVIDQLPKELEYLGGKVTTMSGEDITSKAGTFSYDSAKHTATFKFSADYLESGFKYQLGEKYKVVFRTRVKDNIGDGKVIVNPSKVIINNQPFEGNTVKTPGYEKNKEKKVILSVNQEVTEKTLGTNENTVTFRLYHTLNENPNTTKVQIDDLLEPDFELQSVRFMKDNREVTDQWKRLSTSNKQQLSYQVNAANIKEYLGKTWYTDVTVRVRDDYQKTRIPNHSTLITNFDTVKSNEVYVTPRTITTGITKSILKGTAEVKESSVADGQNVVYRITANVGNKPMTSLVLKDKLEAPLALQEAVVANNGKDVTSQGTLSLSNNTFTWTAKNPNDWRAKTLVIGLKSKFTMNKKVIPYLDKASNTYRIPNQAHIVIDGKDLPSDKVVVVPEVKQPTADKFIVKN
ncbi:isopeptide-forming domain-containing fimbrial protein [Enterococcus cecorum]|nr:isopeptide-forming domain-containing fimbrial protein [Enterococcus cecorum]